MLILKTILRRLRTLLWTAFSIIVILLAVVVGTGKLLMPYSVHYQGELEQWLSREFGKPVAVDSFDGEWTAFGPRLVLHGLKFLHGEDGAKTGDAKVVIGEAALDIRPFNYVLAGRPLYAFRLIGADFELERSADGVYRLSGLGVAANGGGNSALAELAQLGEVVLQDSSLRFIDVERDIRLGARGIDGRLVLEGDRLSLRFGAHLFDARSELEFGEVSGTLVLVLDDERRMDEAEWHVQGNRLLLASFQGKVPPSPFMPLTGWLDTEVWGTWSRGGGHRVNGSVELDDALLSGERDDLHVDRVEGRFRWRYADSGHWNLHLADYLFEHGDLTWSTPRFSVARNLDEGTGLWISADEMPLDAPLSITRDIMSIYGEGWPEGLPYRGAGQVSGLDLVLDSEWGLKRATGVIRGARMIGQDKWPTFDGLDIEVDLHDRSGWLLLSSDWLGLDWPWMFRDAFRLHLEPCRIELAWQEAWQDTWQAGFENCAANNTDVALRGNLLLTGNENRPSIDANFRVEHGDISRLDPYWPEPVMPDSVKQWLRQALLGGNIAEGRALIRGDMDDFPFRNGTGRFEAVARVEDLSLEYLEGWPRVTDSNAVVRFVGASMEATGRVGDNVGSSVDSVVVRIADMKSATLEVDYTTESDLNSIIRFVRETPLQERIGVDLTQFEFEGPASVTGAIRVPLGRQAGELAIDGAVRLVDARFTDPRRGITISEVNGTIEYDERGFDGREFDAVALENPARLDVRADADGEEKFRAEIRGNFPARDVLTDEAMREALGFLERIEGRADWAIALTVNSAEGEDVRVDLGIDSDLAGVVLGLPAPFEKPAEEAWPFRLEYPLDGSERPLEIMLTDRAALRLDLPDSHAAPRRVLINLDGEPGALPPDGLVRISGTAERLDADGWVSTIIDEAARGAGLGLLQLEESAFRAHNMRLMDRVFSDVNLAVGYGGDSLKATFDSRDIEGEVRYIVAEDGAANLNAEFERLALPEPESSGLTMETDPKDLPALHLFARSFQYAGVELGETRIEAFPTASGMRFDMVDARSEAISVQASGDWTLTGDGHRSDFRINMASESLGDFLHSLDITSTVEGGQTLVNFNAWWPGSPGLFALSRLNGQLDFSVISGNITDASTGAGRLLGLVSFGALPKRLALDFRDVFESGFHFDQANGTFSLENGIARTENVVLESSAASIDVVGATDLVEQRYDQVVTIRPGVGNTLPIIGALAAGPGGAAAGLALQGLLHDSLAEATKVRYSISGSWDEPIIEPVEVERAGG